MTAATPASLSAVTVNTGGGFEANVGTYNPSSVSVLSIGTLNAAGNYKIDLSGSAIPVADITILTYTSKTGTGTPSVGTLPFGCTATVEDTGSAIILHVLSPSATSFTWSKGTGDWDTSSLNWNANSVAYTEPALAIFPIAAFGTVNITANRAPFSVDIASTTPNDYTFSGAGKITGTTGITKTGTGAVTFSNAANDYSGTTTISAGALVKATADTTTGAVAITDGATLGLSTGITTGTGQTITLRRPGRRRKHRCSRYRHPAWISPKRFRHQHLGRQYRPRRHRRCRRKHPHRRPERSHPHAHRKHQRGSDRHEPPLPPRRWRWRQHHHQRHRLMDRHHPSLLQRRPGQTRWQRPFPDHYRPYHRHLRRRHHS